MRRHLLFPLLASLLPAQEPATDPLSLIATAERRLERQAPDEDAALLLWQADGLLRAMTGSFARDAALTTLQSLLPRADPIAAERSKTFADAAKKIAAVATLYRLRKWYELAEDRLQLARRFDQEAVQKEVQALAAARGKDVAGKPEPVAKAERALIASMVASNTGGAWTVEEDQLVAPRESPKDANYWYLTTTKHADAELSVEVKITDSQGLATLVFGSVSPRDQFRATLERRAADNWALRCECDSETALDRMQVVDGCPPAARDGWHRLVVRVRGRSVQMQVDDGAMRAEAEMPRPAHGALGFIVYGMGETTPIRFRNLQIGPLPEKVDDASAAAAAQAALRQGLMASVERGEKLLADKKPEAAVLALRQAWAETRRLDAGALRDNLDASIDKLLAKADPVHGRRKKATQDVGALFANLAARYQTVGFLRCALEAADRAAAFDPARAELRQQIEQAMAARDAAEAAARQQELAAPTVDNTALLAAFGSGRPLFREGHPWVVDASGARAQQLTGDELTALLAPDLPQTGGRFAMHLHLGQVGAAGGFVFDAHGDNDFAIAVLHRGPKQLTLSLHRYYLGKWQALGRQPVPVPTWRTAGWFELQIEDLAGHVKASVLEVELQVERSRLGAIGPVGLCAEVAGAGPADVEIRGFRPLQAAR